MDFLEEKDIKTKLFDLIIRIFNDKSLTKNILFNQSQYSDKDIFSNLNKQIKEIIDEKINLGQKDIIHFVGIGSIGIGGLAQIMKNMGFNIQGSDQNKNKEYNKLLKIWNKDIYWSFLKKCKKGHYIGKSSAIKKIILKLKLQKKK